MKHIKQIFLSVALTASTVVGLNAQSPAFTNDQYKKAVWITTRFYGAQRSGDGPNWLIADYEPTNVANDCNGNLAAFKKGKSYVKDADGSYDLTGGWYDCGDFATFGQTFFYSAYMLVLAYTEFPAGYDDLYSADYHGYIDSGDYTYEGKKGVPNGIPDILDEAKYATDFILKAVRDENTFYYQKGDGDADHKVWCTSPTKSTLSVSNGGEADGSRYVGKATGNVTSMASLAGATLAAMSKAYAKFDPAYAAQCLEKAKVCYNFVTKTSKGNSGACAFYGNKPKYITDETIFYAEMYRATGDKQYLTAAENAASSWMTQESGYNHNFSLCYNNTEDLGCYLMASLGDATSYSEYGKTALQFFVNLYKPSSGYFMNKKNDGWGVLRFPANQAFVLALYSKLMGETTINPYALKSIDYILGDNGQKFSYIVGFGNKHPLYPHHRNFYRTDNNNEGDLPTITYDYKYVQLGYLVGGSLNDGAYEDVEKSYTYSEGGIDYNAGLVGALGYINSMLNPVDVNKFGHPTPKFDGEVSICGVQSVVLDPQVSASGQRKFNWYKDGILVSSSTTATTYTATSAGEYTCEIDSAGEWKTSASVIVSAKLPEVEWEEEIQLCSPSTATLDLTFSGTPVTYQWYKDGKAIEKATSATYFVNQAGTYKCEVSATNCGTTTYEVEVTSLLPSIADAESDRDGNITMTVSGDGEYEWYTQAEGGTAVHTGATYTTKITQDTYFYVKDAGEMNITVGPTTSSFTGTGVNWGNIGAAFTATKACQITSIAVYCLGSPYNTGSQTVTAELAGSATGSFTSDAFTVSGGDQFYTVNFSTPIEIPSAGNYTLTIKASGFANPYYQSMTDYSSFANQGNPLTFTGSTNSNGGFPGLANWQVMTGSGCDRAVVKAIKGNGTDVNEATADAAITLAPNPCHDVLYINIANENNVQYEILNMIGTTVKADKASGDELRNGINVANLSAGIYLIRINDNERTIVERFVKK